MELGTGGSVEMVTGIHSESGIGAERGGLAMHQCVASHSPATHRLCVQKAQLIAHSPPERIHLFMLGIRLSALPCAYT